MPVVLLFCGAVAYDAVTYSSFSLVSNMRCPGASTTPLNPAITNTRLRRLNWLINTYFNPMAGINPTCTLPASAGTLLQGYFQSETATQPGTYGPATAADIQAAVWAMAGEPLFLMTTSLFSFMRSVTRFNDGHS